MKMLPKGANAPLATSGILHVDLRWNAAQGALNAVHFAVAEDGRVPSDACFIFHGRRQTPDGAVRMAASAPGHCGFILQLDLIPPQIQRCVFAAALTAGAFRELQGAAITASAGTGVEVGFEPTGADEQALIFAEVYRHRDAWKFRAVGQGFLGGLSSLAEHFGVADIAAALRAPAPDVIPPPSPAPSRDAAPDPTPQPPSSDIPRPRSGGRLFKILATLVLVLAAGIAGLWYFQPSLLQDPAALWSKSTTLMRQLPMVYQEPTCAWTDEQVFERYHALGESYVKILTQVDASNKRLTRLRNDLIASERGCPASFNDDNRREIERLEQLPVAAWKDESTQLNICAGLMIKGLESSLNAEARPIIIQRLVQETDRARNLESDLTNISRDLAYLRNKAERLVEGFRDNLDACP
ncbi:stress protein [Thiorhodococcus mannitoliphagus]|uniref:Stress protein n=1 Tax=Thiorhodococcus mannitoliphagus TaxID=329406 RepID=A0A6P1DY16_9GAMM|nr:TerD family protein [Thiorhodococcus mannitoliphagus]NEX21032.1 stress protein [Thiorhodococcus mannitoliphagus]